MNIRHSSPNPVTGQESGRMRRFRGFSAPIQPLVTPGGASVALAYVPARLADDPAGADGFEVEILGHLRPARLVTEPLYDPAGERMRG